MVTIIVNFAKRHITLSIALCLTSALISIALAAIAGLNNDAVDKYEDVAKAQKSCHLKNGEACFTLGEVYLYKYHLTEDDQNLAKATQAYQKGCDLNNGLSCAMSGFLNLNGTSTSKEAAKDLLQKGCDLNSAYGCTYLGFMYSTGQGVEEDLVKARQLLQKGCMLNEGAGCFMLGYMYQSGHGVDYDLDAARTLFQKGCELNYADACNSFQQLNQQYQALVPVEDIDRLKKMNQDLMLYQQYNDQMNSTLENTRSFVLDSQNAQNVFNLKQ